MANSKKRMLAISLDAADYQALDKQALVRERDAIQEARWILKRALREGFPADPECHPDREHPESTVVQP